jgi:nicotinamide-nucleotide amidase
MAFGVIDSLDASASIAVTGVAGPGGGTPDKPVGLVYLHTVGPDGDRGLELNIPGDREAVRTRATVTALHLLRRLLTQSRHEAA